MFGDEFWSHCVIIFTRVPMDKKSVKKRLKSTNGKSDDTIAMDYVEVYVYVLHTKLNVSAIKE